jgi:hypothetical protein
LSDVSSNLERGWGHNSFRIYRSITVPREWGGRGRGEHKDSGESYEPENDVFFDAEDSQAKSFYHANTNINDSLPEIQRFHLRINAAEFAIGNALAIVGKTWVNLSQRHGCIIRRRRFKGENNGNNKRRSVQKVWMMTTLAWATR